ncbi:MAG: hypothetical protein PHT02_01545 [Tissierellia bacterium]|nr:hypothetical protein [Tissierellia bacterium]
MKFRFLGSNITDMNIEQKLNNLVKFDKLDENKEYDISVEFFNNDLIEDSLNEDVSYELKKKHYVFIRKVRNFFEKNNIKINKFYLMGTIIDLVEKEIKFSVKKSNNKGKKSNIVWPCKEIFIYEDNKNKLDTLLFSNQISLEEYESNLEDLKYELSIFENEEEHEYIN